MTNPALLTIEELDERLGLSALISKNMMDGRRAASRRNGYTTAAVFEAKKEIPAYH